MFDVVMHIAPSQAVWMRTNAQQRIIASMMPVKRMGQGLKAGNQAGGEGNNRDMHRCQI